MNKMDLDTILITTTLGAIAGHFIGRYVYKESDRNMPEPEEPKERRIYSGHPVYETVMTDHKKHRADLRRRVEIRQQNPKIVRQNQKYGGRRGALIGGLSGLGLGLLVENATSGVTSIQNPLKDIGYLAKAYINQNPRVAQIAEHIQVLRTMYG